MKYDPDDNSLRGAWRACSAGFIDGIDTAAAAQKIDRLSLLIGLAVRLFMLQRAVHHARRGDTARTVLWSGLLSRAKRPVPPVDLPDDDLVDPFADIVKAARS